VSDHIINAFSSFIAKPLTEDGRYLMGEPAREFNFF
jgi:hypothetical protein